MELDTVPDPAQVYELAPDAVSNTVFPEHMVILPGVIETKGTLNVEILMVLVLRQPKGPIPVTV